MATLLLLFFFKLQFPNKNNRSPGLLLSADGVVDGSLLLLRGRLLVINSGVGVRRGLGAGVFLAVGHHAT